jgi:hypothetical protein
MWVAEMTWPAAQGKANPPYLTGYMKGFLTTKAGAAKRLKEGYRLLAGLRTQLKLDRVYWFWSTSAYTGSNEFEYSGLLRYDGKGLAQTPAFKAYKSSARGAEGCAKSANGNCR